MQGLHDHFMHSPEVHTCRYAHRSRSTEISVSRSMPESSSLTPEENSQVSVRPNYFAQCLGVSDLVNCLYTNGQRGLSPLSTRMHFSIPASMTKHIDFVVIDLGTNDLVHGENH